MRQFERVPQGRHKPSQNGNPSRKSRFVSLSSSLARVYEDSMSHTYTATYTLRLFDERTPEHYSRRPAPKTLGLSDWHRAEPQARAHRNRRNVEPHSSLASYPTCGSTRGSNSETESEFVTMDGRAKGVPVARRIRRFQREPFVGGESKNLRAQAGRTSP